MTETSITDLGKTSYFSTDKKKLINAVKKLASEHPDKVIIKADPETNHGCVYVTIPSDWVSVKLKPPAKREYTEEQRQKMAARMKKARNHQPDWKECAALLTEEIWVRDGGEPYLQPIYRCQATKECDLCCQTSCDHVMTEGDDA